MASIYKEPLPYTHHTEREERYHHELLELQGSGADPKDIEESQAQALKNACSSEFIDATMNLTGRRVRVHYKGNVLSTEHTIVRIVKLGEFNSAERACFAVVYQNSKTGVEETLPIFPST